MPDPVPNLVSTIACPHCGASRTETMPTDACQFFYDCTGCGRLLRPKPGDCCVFCSYGDVPCPPMQSSPGNAPCCDGAPGAEPSALASAPSPARSSRPPLSTSSPPPPPLPR